MSGIVFALLALFGWGFGDFFIQRAVRIAGIWKTLFFIGIVGFLLLSPFAWNTIASGSVTQVELLMLVGIGIIAFLAAFADFEALKEGKLAIVEPIIGLELPATILLSVFILGETLTTTHLLLTITVFVGIILTVTIHHTHLHYHRRIFEKGVLYSFLGAAGLALVDFSVGFVSKSGSPLFIIWFIHSVLAILALVQLVRSGEIRMLAKSFRERPGVIVAASLLDNGAWVAYAFATSLLPISITITLTESYIALAALLGIFINREKLKRHQLIGIVITVVSVILLSIITN